MISIYSEAPAKDASLGAGKPFKVYNQKSRRSDDRNPLDYGMLFDPATPFFTQFQKLLNQVPLQALIGANNENSDYINLTADSKNCYIVIESSNNEDCYHCYRIQKCKRCCDCSFCHECEHCYETHNCKFCYNTARIQDSQKCANSMFLRDCLGCSYCFGCSNLVNKSYCVYNQQVSKEEYEKFIKELYTGNICNNLRDAREKFHMLDLQLPKKFAHLTHVENTTGDYLNNAKNCSFCSDGYDVEECKYGEHVRRNAKFVMDGSTVGRDAELIYEAINCGIGAQHNSFVAICRSSSYMNYCFSCFSCTNCFGCV